MSLYNLIGVLSGCLGAINSFITGFYIITTYFEIALYSRKSAENLLYPAYTAVILTTALALILVYGSFLIWRGNTRKGGIINLLVGTILSLIYTYYTIFSQPPLLSWLGPIGFLLLIPAIMSGAVGIIIETPKN